MLLHHEADLLLASYQSGKLVTDFDEFVEKARNNSSVKQCKKSCSRSYKANSRSANNCLSGCDQAYASPAPTPWDYFPAGGQCSNRCTSDSDCQKGGFNPCGSCGQYVGTLMYQRCYAPNPYEGEA